MTEHDDAAASHRPDATEGLASVAPGLEELAQQLNVKSVLVMRSEPDSMVVAATITGLAGAGGAVLFRLMIRGVQSIAWGDGLGQVIEEGLLVDDPPPNNGFDGQITSDTGGETPIALGSGHPNLMLEAPLSHEQRQALMEDLTI